jgi:hypothetical protein
MNEETNIYIEDLELICPFYMQQLWTKDNILKNIVIY